MDLPDKTAPVSAQPTPRQPLKPVISGVVAVKRPATRRFLDFIFAESPKDIAVKIGRDLLVPRAKVAFLDAANGFLSGMLLGNGNANINILGSSTMRGGGMNYQAISSVGGMTPMAQAMAANQAAASVGYQDLVVPTQRDAEILLSNMFALLNKFNAVTVADLKEMANQGTSISDNSYGWRSLDGARIVAERNGFSLQLPKPTIVG